MKPIYVKVPKRTLERLLSGAWHWHRSGLGQKPQRTLLRQSITRTLKLLRAHGKGKTI